MAAQRTVLVIGLGKMGGAIAGRLVRDGWRVLGFDLDAGARERAAQTGVVPVSTLAEGIGASTLVMTSLPDPTIVRAGYLNPGGIVGLLQPDSVVIELSTIDPFTMREVAERLEAGVAGVRVVDAPVSGGIEEAAEGKLSLMVSGAGEAVDAAREALESIGTIRPCGQAPGDGKVVKLVNNLVAISNVLGAVEALALAEAAEVDPHVLHAVLSQSGASSYQLNKRLPRIIENDLAPRFSLSLAAKDLRLALELADRLGVDLTSGRAVLERFAEAEDRGWGVLDMAAVTQFYPHRNNDPAVAETSPSPAAAAG